VRCDIYVCMYMYVCVYIYIYVCMRVYIGAWGSRATSRRVPGSNPGGVTWDFFRGASDGTMCPGVDSVSKNEYQEFSWG
jgi:hypothetical protein